jgi:hypothetical protein
MTIMFLAYMEKKNRKKNSVLLILLDYELTKGKVLKSRDQRARYFIKEKKRQTQTTLGTCLLDK